MIENIPLGGSCRGCGSRFVAEEQFILSCPHCGSGDFFLDAGRELDITEIEVE
jgi:Zn finger protein HypA/HybF involved in hydrogenase expression